MDHFNRLGKAIKWLREDAELRQNEVAGKAGITKAMISSYESGRSLPTVATLDKILGALGADLFALCNALELVNGRQPQRQLMAQPSNALEALALGDMSPGEMEAFELIVGGFRRWLVHLRESASQIRR